MRITNFPDSGSAERVAFDLMNKIAFMEGRASENQKTEGRRDYVLQLYKECLHLTKNGFRIGE